MNTLRELLAARAADQDQCLELWEARGATPDAALVRMCPAGFLEPVAGELCPALVARLDLRAVTVNASGIWGWAMRDPVLCAADWPRPIPSNDESPDDLRYGWYGWSLLLRPVSVEAVAQ